MNAYDIKIEGNEEMRQKRFAAKLKTVFDAYASKDKNVLIFVMIRDKNKKVGGAVLNMMSKSCSAEELLAAAEAFPVLLNARIRHRLGIKES